MTKRKEINKLDDIVASTSSGVENHVKAVYYKSLSVNTHNSLEMMQLENPDISILHRPHLIPFEEKELEKIDHALKLGFKETCKDLNERSDLGASFENLNKKVKTLVKNEEDSSKRIKKELEFVFDDHLIELDDFIRRYETNVSEGLNDEHVELRLKRDGKNVLKKRKNKPVFVRWLIEVFGGYNIIMWVATILCLLCWQPLGGDNPSVYNLVLTIFLFVVIMIQSTVSFIQQFHSDNMMASFEKLMPLKSSVLRNGKWDDVNSSDLVVGDVVRMSSGDKIPADLRIIDCQQASIDKSCLTGESEPVKLNLFKIESNPYETKNIAMFGSLLMEGAMIGIVFQTGEKTIMAKVASLAMSAKGEITTMQREINYFAVIIGSMSIGTGLLTFIIWLTAIKPQHPTFFNYSGIISTCIGVVISFFPEGLPMAVTMTLTLIAKKMKKANVLVKKMAIIETLGSTTVIASDKTGTITMNKMTLTHLSITNQVEYDCLNESNNPLNDFYKLLVSFASLCNKAIIIQKNEENMSEKEYKGSATECGILKFSNNFLSIEDLRGKNPIINEIPFNSRNKFHLTLHRLNKESIIPSTCHSVNEASKDKDLLCIIKGAPEIIIDLCRKGLNNDQIEDFNQTKEFCLNESVKLARNGERVLGLAFAFVSIKDPIVIDEDHLPQELCFAGLLSLIDPPRPGVAEAVSSCHDGSIKVMMVTGDHPLTAVSIAKMVNIVSSDRVKNFQDLENELSRIVPYEEPTPKCQALNNKFKFINSIKQKLLPKKAKIIAKKYNVEGAVVILGKDIPALAVEQWDFILSHNEIVFARTTPQNKLLIVKQLQRRGEIVTVTGDGVNDAPALRKADIGIAMGITGTEVSKEAAKVIIMDDNFATIVSGITQGRLLFNNLKKVIGYLLPAGCFSEILPVLSNVFLGLPTPLTTLAMLVICLMTDILGSVGMIYEYPESDIMKRKPRDASVDRLISFKGILKIYIQIGVLQSIIAFFMYFYTMKEYGIDGTQLVGAFEKWNINGTFAGADLDTRNNALAAASTAFFVSLVMTQLINILTVRTTYQSIFRQRFRPALLLFMLGEIVIVILFCYIPTFQPYFQTANMNWYNFVFPLALGLSIIIIDEIKKLLFRKYPKSCIRHLIF